MKWGVGKKPSSSSTSTRSPSSSTRPSLISNVLPTSWISKLKRMSINSGQYNDKCKPKGQWRCPNEGGGSGGGGGGGDGLYGGEDDAFWRLSFREEIVDGINSGGSVVRSVWYHNLTEDERPQIQKPSSCQGCTNIRDEKDVGDVREAIGGLPREAENSQDIIGEKVAQIRTPRLRIESGNKLRRDNQRKLSENQLDLGREADHVEMVARRDSIRNGNIKRKDRTLAGFDGRGKMDQYPWNFEEDSKIRNLKQSGGLVEEKMMTSEWRKLQKEKMEDIEQRKSLYLSKEVTEKRRTKQKAVKVKAYSPRLASKAEICKIKALEDMKKTKKKMEKRKKGFTGLESFAVVKTSLDPHKDFQESMMEMINERGISQPEELEQLLACYLTLNVDEYHDLIIKVFRKVLFETNQATSFIVPTDNEKLSS